MFGGSNMREFRGEMVKYHNYISCPKIEVKHDWAQPLRLHTALAYIVNWTSVQTIRYNNICGTRFLSLFILLLHKHNSYLAREEVRSGFLVYVEH